MGLVLLVLLYCLLAATLAAGGLVAARRLPGDGTSWPAAVFLSLLPLAYTWAGFLPDQTLSPTPMVAGAPPWSDPFLVESIREGSSPANPLLLDAVSQFIPWREAARSDLLFNPAQGAGAALLANGQSAVLFPTEVLARLLVPFRAVAFSQAARLLLGIWGMFLLARYLAASEAAALVAATVWSGAGFLHLWRLHPHTLVAAAAPWILLGIVALVRRPGPRPAVALAVVGAIAFAGGHPETLLHVLLFGLPLAGLVLYRDPLRPEGSPGRLRSRLPAVVAWSTAAAILSVLLAAPVLLPFVEILPVSAEWQYRGEVGTVVEVPLAPALERLRPSVALRALGHPIDGSWDGPRNLAEVGGGSIGAAALLLALMGLSRRGTRRWAAGLLALGLLGLAVSVHLPLISRPFGWIPLVKTSLLNRLSLWWVLAAPLLASLAVDEWQERRPGGGAAGLRRWRQTLLGGGAAVAALLLWAAGPPWTVHPAILAAGWGGLVLASSLLALPHRPWAWAALLAVLLVPRAGQLWRWVPVATWPGFYLETPAVDWLQERLGDSSAGWRVAGVDGALVPHSASFFGLEEVRANDPMTFAAYQDFLIPIGPKPHGGWQRVDDPAHPSLRFLGVRYVMAHPDDPRRPLPIAYAGADARLYEVPAPLPRVFVPRRVTVVPDRAEAIRRTRSIHDFADLAIVSDGRSVATGGTRENGAARCREVRVDGRRVTAVVDAEGSALVATSQPAIPGWRLAVDGVETEPILVNGAFLGAEVAPGSHRIELVYAPRAFRVGLAASSVGLLGGLLLWRLGRAPQR